MKLQGGIFQKGSFLYFWFLYDKKEYNIKQLFGRHPRDQNYFYTFYLQLRKEPPCKKVFSKCVYGVYISVCAKKGSWYTAYAAKKKIQEHPVTAAPPILGSKLSAIGQMNQPSSKIFSHLYCHLHYLHHHRCTSKNDPISKQSRNKSELNRWDR